MPTRSVATAASVAGLMLALTACGGPQQIVHQMDESEANEVMVVLEAKGISAEKVKEEGRVVTWAVQVSDVDSKNAMRILVANHLPRARSQGLKEVYPAGGGGLIPTKSEEKAKYLMAIQGEIERKLKSLPGIVAAHCSIVQPDKDIVRDLDTPPPASTASVAIVYNAISDRGVAAVKEDEVRALVAASVEDLKPSNVTVVMKQNAPTPLVDNPFDSQTVDSSPVAVSQFGLKFADKESARNMLKYGGAGVAIALLSVAVGIGGIVRSLGLRRRAAKSEADLTAMRKARRETASGLPGT